MSLWFCGVTVTFTFVLQNVIISFLESSWIFVPHLKTFPQGVLEISRSQDEMDRQILNYHFLNQPTAESQCNQSSVGIRFKLFKTFSC